MSLIPISSVSVSSSTPDLNIVNMFDNNLDTFWKPTLNSDNNYYVQINFYFPHKVEYLDIIFNKSDIRRYTFTISVLSENNNRWVNCRTIETNYGDVERFHISVIDKVKSVKVTFLQYVEGDNNIGLLPEVCELRVYGILNGNEIQSSFTIPDLPCPKGYFLKSKKCIKNVKFNPLESQIKVVNGKIIISFKKDVKLNKIETQGSFFMYIPCCSYQGIINGSLIFDKTIENVNRIELTALSDYVTNSIKCYGEK